MKIRHWLRFAALICAAAFWSAAAQAASCSITMNPGFTSFYDPAAPTPTDNVSSVTIYCTRSTAAETTINFALKANNGLWASGSTNRAASAANAFVNYDVYRNTARTQAWGQRNNVDINGTVDIRSGAGSTTVSYYSRIPAGQTGVAAGAYSDTVTVTLVYSTNLSTGTTTAPSSTFPVLIMVNPACQFSTPPGTIAFAYTSFQGTAANASTPFAVLCSNGLPYTLSLDSLGGTLLGVNYTLALSASAATGTGVSQAYTVNGSIAAGQAGSCATATCTASKVHTLTITY